MKPNRDLVDSMNPENRQQYLSKLKTTSGSEILPDPYVLEDSFWSEDETKWPPMQYADLYNYLISTPSEFTHKSLKAYRSLEAYNYFLCGHVQRCYFYDVPSSECCFVRSFVLPGQRQNLKNVSELYDAWVCLNKSGVIHAAACSCMAG